MPPETTATAVAFSAPFVARPASGWTSWAPEVVDAIDSGEPDVGMLGGVLSLLMWGCASLLAVWYL